MESGAAVSSAAVVGGTLDIGKSSAFALIQGHARGVPFVLESVAALYNSDKPNVGMVVARDGSLSSARDFVNDKIIASPSLGDLYASVAAAWIDMNGGDSKNLKFIELPTNVTAAAIAARRIDGAVMTDPFAAEAVESGHCRIIGKPFDAIARHFGFTYYFCTADYATKNAGVTRRFRRALVEATDAAASHPYETAELIASFTHVSRDVAAKSRVVLGNGVDPAMLQPTIDFAARAKTIPAAFAARDLIDPTALR